MKTLPSLRLSDIENSCGHCSEKNVKSYGKIVINFYLSKPGNRFFINVKLIIFFQSVELALFRRTNFNLTNRSNKLNT